MPQGDGNSMIWSNAFAEERILHCNVGCKFADKPVEGGSVHPAPPNSSPFNCWLQIQPHRRPQPPGAPTSTAEVSEELNVFEVILAEVIPPGGLTRLDPIDAVILALLWKV